MIKKIMSIMLLATILFSFSIGVAAEKQINNKELIEEDNSEQEEQEEIGPLTLQESIDLALENNLEKIAIEKQMALQDIQIEISEDGNIELKKLARNLERVADDMSSQVLAVQAEVRKIKNYDFSVPTTSGSIEVLGKHYDDLKKMPFSNQVLSNLEKSYGGSVVRNMPPDTLIQGLKKAESELGEAFFEIETGRNQTVKQANQMAASVLGLQATRRLKPTQATNIIRTKTKQSAELIVYSDTDTSEGFKLLAESSFYNLLQAKKMLDVEEHAYSKSKKQYDDSLLTFEQGLMSKSDLQLVKMQLNSNTISKKAAEIDYKKAMIDFNQAIGVDLNTEIELIEPEYEKIELELEEALDIAKKYRTDMFTARQQVELAELNLEYVDDRHREDSIEYKESLAYLQHQDATFENDWVKAKNAVIQSYLDYQQANYSYQIVKENLEIMKDQLKIAELSYEIGYSASGGSPLVALLEAQERYASVEQGIASAEFGRNLAMQNYLKEIGYAHFIKEEE